MTDRLQYFYYLLAKKPLIGMITPTVSGILFWVEQLSPIMQFTGFAIGAAVGILSAVHKYIQIKKDLKK